MSSTTVEYAGETMYGVVTLECRQTKLADPTGTDSIADQFNLRFQGFMHTGGTDIHGFSNQEDAVGDSYIKLRRKMMEWRKDFKWTVGGVDVLRVFPHPKGVSGLIDRDVDNGPKPQEFVIRKVIGGRVLEVEFSIQVTVLDCEALENTSGVISNRWAIIDAIDENWYTTRTYQGELITTSAQIDPKGPHFFRNWVIPPLPNGFKRERMEFTSSPDGVKLLYTIVDRQVSLAPPRPATSWSGTHRVLSQNNTGGIGTTISIDLRLSGPEGATKHALFAAAAAVARDRLVYETATSAAILEEIELVDIIAESETTIEMRLKVFKPGSIISDLGAAEISKIGSPLNISGYNRFESRNPKPFGTATTAGLLVAHLQSGCDEKHRFTDAGDPGSGGSGPNAPDRGGQGVVTETYEGIGTFNPASGPYSTSHFEAPYRHYRVESKYTIGAGRCALPIGDTDSTGGDTVVVAKLHREVVRWIVKVAAERVGRTVDLPLAQDFQDGGIKYYFMDATIVNAAPEFTADGQKKKHVSYVQYEYQLSRPIGPGEGLRTGRLPWDQVSTVDSNRLSTDAFKEGIA